MGYVLAPAAVEDLDLLWDYLAHNISIVSADSVLANLHHSFQLISDHPGIGRSRDDIAVGLRSFPDRNSIVFYRIDYKSIRIVRVLDGRRDLVKILTLDAR